MLRFCRLCLLWLVVGRASAEDIHTKKFHKPEASLRRRLIEETNAAAPKAALAEGEAVETGGETPVVVDDHQTIEATQLPAGEPVKDTPAVVETTPTLANDSQTGSGGSTEIIVTPPGGEEVGAGKQQTPDAEIPKDESGNNPPAQEDTINTCIEAMKCADCQTAAIRTQATNQGSTCLWEEANKSCTFVQQDEFPADMCLEKNASAAPPPADTDNSNFDDNDGGGSAFTLVVGVLAVVLVGGAVLRFRKQAARFGSGGDDGKSTAVGDFSSIMGSVASRSTYNKSETVPLARATADDDEEWGWEDSSAGENCDVEMTAKNDDEDLTMAFAMSHTRPSAPKPSRPKSSPVVSRPPSYSHNINTTDAAAPAMPAMQIASLGVKKTTGTSLANKKKSMKKKDDDLFASMGLAAKPTFSQVLKSKAPVKTRSSALAATDLGGDADWDDDGDLDDLLND